MRREETGRQMAVWWVLALVAGGLVSFQAIVNTRLGGELASPMTAALVSFVVGTIAMLVVVLVSRSKLPDVASFSVVPAVFWIGGLFGAIYVASVIVLTPRMGVALMSALTIAGQLVLATIADHFGWLGTPVHPFDVNRAVALVLFLAACFFLARS